jgi:ribose-phosphate pyrophosphokinase
VIIGGSASQDLAAHVARELDEELCYVETRKFPDGERYLRITEDVKDEEVIVIQSTGYPQDENLMELIFIISNLKDLGAKKVRVVVPYLGYARQEKRFNPGETISAKIICNLIQSAGADEFITFNIHEECVLNFFDIPAKNVSAMPSIA